MQPLTERVSDLAVVSQIAFIGLLSPYPFVQIKLIQQRIIKPNEFRDAQPPHRADQPSLADGLDRFCQDHRGLQKSPITVHKNVGLVIGLLCIIIWNGFILDGHTRYRILRKHPFIVYQIQEIELANRYAALSWICQNQLGRRNLDPERKKFLMGKLYESEKLARGGSKERAHDENGRFTSMVQNDPLRAKQLSTCERIAAQNGVGAATVKRAEKYAKGVDAAEDAVPGAREEILTGRIKATDAEITALAKTPKAEIPAALAELRKPKQERQPRKAETSSSKQTLSEISKSIQGHQRQLTTEERTFLKASIDNRYQERVVANGSLMMCEVKGAKEDFIRRWNSIFKEYPDVFEDSDCRKIIHDLTEDAVQYLLKIKEKTL